MDAYFFAGAGDSHGGDAVTNPRSAVLMLPDWDRWFPNCEPVGHHLRKAFRKRWVRLHSLPGSKRYPENDVEYEEVLTRHNVILGELTRSGEQVVLLTTGFSQSPMPTRPEAELSEVDPGAQPWRTVAMHRADEALTSPNYWHVFASTHQWRPGALDQLVRLVADEVVSNALVVAPDCRWVLHPYDGGMDVIVESPAYGASSELDIARGCQRGRTGCSETPTKK